MSLFTELKRRNVVRVSLTYLVVAWLLIQIANNVVAPLGLPAWTTTLVIVLLALGFPVALILAWAFELTPKGLKRESARIGDVAPVRAFGRKWDFVIIAGLILALGYFVWHQYLGPSPRPVAAENAASSTAPSIAVLPFSNLSADKDQDYFADGVTEELLNSLSQLKGLKVAGRTSSFYFKGKNEDLRTVGKMLDVGTVLEGSVRKSGDELRITAQLINAGTGYHLWSKTYDRKLTDIFAIQDEVSKAVAEAVGVTLGVGETAGVPGMTRNVDAYEEFLKGRDILTYHLGLDTVEPAIEHLQRAIALDPSFSVAWLTLAGAYRNGENFFPSRAEEWDRKALEAVARAHELTPNSPRVLIYQVENAALHGNFRLAGELFDRLPLLIAKYGAGAFELHRMGSFYFEMGIQKKAIDYLQKARSLDPLDLSVSTTLAQSYVYAGMTDAAMAEFERGPSIGGNQISAAFGQYMAALGAGDRQEISKRLAALSAAAPTDPAFAIIFQVARHLDAPKAGIGTIKQIIANGSKGMRPGMVVMLAIWAAYYGDPEYALSLLRTVKASSAAGAVPASLWLPVMSSVRKLPAFKDYLKEIGFLAYLLQPGHANDHCHAVRTDDIECD